jgi:hypothetical protein
MKKNSPQKIKTSFKLVFRNQKIQEKETFLHSYNAF